MRSPLLLLLACSAAAVLSLATLCNAAEASKLACGVCEALVDEVNQSILETTHTHSVQTRFRVDEKRRTPYARTEHNLLDILESDSLIQRFRKYGVVKPWTKTAREMKKGYEQGASGAGENAATEGAAAEATQATPAEPQVAEAKEPAAPVSATTTDENAAPASTDAAAAAAAPAADGTAAPATDAAAAAAAAAATPAAPAFTPFRPSGSLPLALQFNHPHLALSSLKALHNLVGIDSSSATHSAIRSQLESFLEEYLDEALMMFHKDVPQLKQKLCVEITEACKPAKPRTKKQKMEESAAAAGAKRQETKTEAAPAAAAASADAVKDEL